MSYDFQEDVYDWMIETFGLRILLTREERNFRLAEEAVECLQASGMSKEAVLKTVERVYDRKVGRLEDEIGDTLICLAALAHEAGLRLDTVGRERMICNWSRIAEVRAKWEKKQLKADGIER